MTSIRLNSSRSLLFNQPFQICRKASAGGAPRAVRPALVSSSLLPRRQTSLLACSSQGQAIARTGPISGSHRPLLGYVFEEITFEQHFPDALHRDSGGPRCLCTDGDLSGVNK